ncbi:MAG: DUF7507 domain-containing protein [Microcella sp.]
MQHYPNSRARRRAAAAAWAVTLGLAVVAVPALPLSPAAAQQSPSACAPVALENGSFETPTIAANSWSSVLESAVPGWETSATDNRIEIWRSPFQGVPVPQGSQFAEINANQRATMFQDVATTPGETIRWQVQHRGRTGVDVMEVRLGAPDATLALQTTASTGLTWTTYSGLYTVPAGQTTTRLAFVSISSANGNATFGNFIDDVSVTSSACLVTTKSVDTSAASDPVRLGETLTYTISTRNDGGAAATGVVLSDVLPAGVTLVSESLSSDLGTYDPATRELRVPVGAGATGSAGGSLAVGASATVSFSVVVDDVAALAGVENTATAQFTDTVTTTAMTSTSNTTETAVAPDAPALSIVTTGTVSPIERQDAAAGGDTITWSYLVTNTGDVALSDVTVVDPEGGTITCVPTTLAVGETATCSGSAVRTVDASDLAVGSVSNGAVAQATPPYGAAAVESTESIATISTAALQPAISVAVSHENLSATDPSSTPMAGDRIRAWFTVTNAGNAPLDNVTVDDPVFGTVTCDAISLEPGARTTCWAVDEYTVTDDDALAGTVSRTVRAAGVSVVGATEVVWDDELAALPVDTELPTLPLPEDDGEGDASDDAALTGDGLADTGADARGTALLALALGLLTSGALALVMTRRRAAR